MSNDLFFRADPIPGESILGFLGRLGGALGYRSHLWISDVFPEHFPRSPHFHKHMIRQLLTSPNLDFLAQKLRLPSSALSAMRFPQDSYRKLSCRGQSFKTADVHQSPLRFCPICVRKYGTHFLVWHFSFVAVCPTHYCCLISHCAKCEHHFDLEIVKNGICNRCEFPILPTFHPDPDLRDTTGLLLTKVGGITGSDFEFGTSDKYRKMPEIFDDVDLSTTVRSSLDFGKLLFKYGLGNGSDLPESHLARLSVGFRQCEYFFCWSIQFLDQEKKNPSNGFYQRTFLRHKHPRIRKHARRAYGLSTDESIRKLNSIKIDEAAAAVGLTKVVLKKLGEKRTSNFARSKWKKSTYLQRAEVIWITRCRDECITCKEASSLLGISDRHQVQAIYDSEIIPHGHPDLILDFRAHYFQKNAIIDVCTNISSLPIRTLSSHEVSWKTAKAMYMARHHSSLDFYRSVLMNRLNPTGRQREMNGFPSLIFNASMVAEVAATEPSLRPLVAPGLTQI